MTSPRAIVPLLAAGLALLLAGCTTLSPPAPVSYRLELDPATVPTLPPQGGVLLLARPQAEAGADTRGIAYRTAPHQIRYYTRSRWADTPPRMLAAVLAAALERSGLFAAVVDDGRLAADYLLTTQLLRLEQIVTEDGAGAFLLRLRMQLIRLPERSLLGSWLIETQAPTTADDAAAGVAAANQALAQAVVEALRSIATAVGAAPGPGR